jgi:hypothetical protein
MLSSVEEAISTLSKDRAPSNQAFNFKEMGLIRHFNILFQAGQ